MAERADYTPREFVASEPAIRGADYALELKAAGSQINGSLRAPTDSDFDTTGHIQVFQWEKKVASMREAATGMASGRRVHFGLHCIGPMSQGGPLIFQALCRNEVIEATLRCFRQRKSKREHFYTVDVKEGRINSYEVLTSPLDGSLIYEFVIGYMTIEETWIEGGVTAIDSWGGQDQ